VIINTESGSFLEFSMAFIPKIRRVLFSNTIEQLLAQSRSAFGSLTSCYRTIVYIFKKAIDGQGYWSSYTGYLIHPLIRCDLTFYFHYLVFARGIFILFHFIVEVLVKITRFCFCHINSDDHRPFRYGCLGLIFDTSNLMMSCGRSCFFFPLFDEGLPVLLV